MLSIDARTSRELQALVLALRRANKEVAGQIRRRTKDMVAPAWQKALAEEATTRFEHRLLVDTARVAVSNQNVKLKSASVGRGLSGGLKPSEGFGGAEFGSDRLNRLRPRKKTGYVVYPAAAAIIPRIFALWAQTAVRTFRDALEGK